MMGDVMLQVISWLASAAILTAYGRFVCCGDERPFHWANALGAIPLVGVEVATHAWPVVPLTATFGIMGWWGALTGDL